MRPWRHIIIACAAGALALACVEPTDQKGLSGATSGVTINVIDVSGFTPESVTVASGTTVTWAWAGNNTYQHNVVFDNGDTALASGLQQVGTYQATFATAKNYHYHCTVHGEKGVVAVR